MHLGTESVCKTYAHHKSHLNSPVKVNLSEIETCPCGVNFTPKETKINAPKIIVAFLPVANNSVQHLVFQNRL